MISHSGVLPLSTHRLSAFAEAVQHERSYVADPDIAGDLEPLGWYGLFANELTQWAGPLTVDPRAPALCTTPATVVNVCWGGVGRPAMLRLHWAVFGAELPAAMVAELFVGHEGDDGTVNPRQVLARVAIMQREGTDTPESAARYLEKLAVFERAFSLYVCAAGSPDVMPPDTNF